MSNVKVSVRLSLTCHILAHATWRCGSGCNEMQTVLGVTQCTDLPRRCLQFHLANLDAVTFRDVDSMYPLALCRLIL